MTKRLLLSLLCFIPSLLFAQSAKLKVEVSDVASYNPIGSAVITYFDPSGHQLGYVLTNSSGVAFLPTTNQLHKVRIKKMGYHEKEIELSGNPKEVIQVALEEKGELLPEFVYTIPAIQRKNDTIVYNAGSFVTPKDTYLRDLLEKLPGVRINEIGKVYYQGEPIKRFYIEGKDLLGSQYSLATENLSVESVSKVEILEQYQDVKLLQGIVPESKSSMNIVLKESYKARYFGYIEGGIGYEPLLYESKANATKVSKSPLQYYILGVADNHRAESVDTPLSINVSELNSLAPQNGVRSSTGIGGKPIDAKYYIRNRCWQLSTNGLLSFSEEDQLRLNLTGGHDWLGQEEEETELYKELNQSISERRINESGLTRFCPTLAFELNSRNKYVSDKLVADMGWSERFNHIYGSKRELTYRPRHNYWWLQNNLETTLPLKEDRSLLGRVYSKILYGASSNHLGIEGLDNPLFQNEWQAKHGFETHIGLPKSMTLSISIDDHLFIRKYEVDRVENELVHNELELNPRWAIPFMQKRGRLTLGAALTHTTQRIAEQTACLWDLSPNLNVRYKSREGWEYILSSSYRRYLPRASSYFSTTYRLSHRSQATDYLESYKVKQWNLMAQINYSNLFSYFFGSASLRYIDTRSPLVRDVSLSPDGFTSLTSLRYEGHSQGVTGEIKADKSFTDQGVNIVLDGLYNFTSTPSSLNRTIAQGYFHNYWAQLSVIYRGIDWLVVSWKSSYQQVRSQRGSNNPWHTSAQVGSDLSLQFALSPNLNLECSYEWRHFTKEENSSHPDFHLLSGSMDWKVSKRLRLSLQCNNLLNSDDYVTRIDSPISQQISLLKLRPRSIFAKASWSY